MNGRLIPATALGAVLLAALAAAGCDRQPGTGSAALNTGNSASSSPERLGPSTTVAPVTGDTASPGTSTAAAPSTGSAGIGGAMGETATTGKVKAAIAADSGLRDTDISVSTDNGVVTLSGTVKSQDQVAIATQLAQRQEGVTSVQNNLSVQ